MGRILKGISLCKKNYRICKLRSIKMQYSRSKESVIHNLNGETSRRLMENVETPLGVESNLSVLLAIKQEKSSDLKKLLQNAFNRFIHSSPTS